MSSATRMRRPQALRLGLAGLALVVIAGILGWRAGETAVPSRPVNAVQPWSLPVTKTADTARDLAALTRRKPWGVNLTPAQVRRVERARSVPRWRLAGIIERGGESLALIADLGPRPKFEYRRIGDSLPDGSKLVEITADSAVTEGGQSPNSGRQVYTLFTQKLNTDEVAVNPRRTEPRRNVVRPRPPQNRGPSPTPRP